MVKLDWMMWMELLFKSDGKIFDSKIDLIEFICD